MRIGLLGAGTVGAAVARGLVSRAEEWQIEIAGIAVRDLAKAQAAGLDRLAPLTTDPAALAASADVDVVVELMGGLDPAMPIVEAALKAGRPVVTAKLAFNHIVNHIIKSININKKHISIQE